MTTDTHTVTIQCQRAFSMFCGEKGFTINIKDKTAVKLFIIGVAYTK